MRKLAAIILSSALIWMSAPAFAEEFNPYIALNSINEFAFINAYFATESGEKLTGLGERELKNYVILRVRNTFRDVPYKEKEFSEIKKGDGRLFCRVYTVESAAVGMASAFAECAIGIAGGAEIWSSGSIGIVGSNGLGATVKKLLDNVIERGAGEFYRARAERR